MFERLEAMAQGAADNVSRRQFLGNLSHRAVVVAGVVGGLLAASPSAEAGRRLKCCPKRLRCDPQQKKGCTLIACVQVGNDFPDAGPGCRWECDGTIVDIQCGSRRGSS